MQPFLYVRAQTADQAVEAGQRDAARFVAGGTTMIDLMRLEVMRPASLVDITGLPLAQIEELGGGVRIGALATNTDVAYHPLVTARFPALAEALLSGASRSRWPRRRSRSTCGAARCATRGSRSEASRPNRGAPRTPSAR